MAPNLTKSGISKPNIPERATITSSNINAKITPHIIQSDQIRNAQIFLCFYLILSKCVPSKNYPVLTSPLLLSMVREAHVGAELQSVDIERCLPVGYSCEYAAVEVTCTSYPWGVFS